jgi:hypothetical protein
MITYKAILKINPTAEVSVNAEDINQILGTTAQLPYLKKTLKHNSQQ